MDHGEKRKKDPADITELNFHYEYKWTCLDRVSKEEAEIDHLPLESLREKCKGNVTHTPKRAKHTFKRQLSTLRERLINTGEEHTQEEWFRDDINQPQLNVQQVLDAGVANVDKIFSFDRYGPGKTPLYH